MASCPLPHSPTGTPLISKRYQLSGAASPYGLQHTLCTLHLSCSPVRQIGYLRSHRSARGATLGSGGWLALTTSGLPPDQICHAFFRGARRRRDGRLPDRPRHRSRRAVFPHRAPQSYSLSQIFRYSPQEGLPMNIRPYIVRHRLPLRTAYDCHPLPHVNGPTVSEYYEMIRLPTIRQAWSGF